jgi:hypothetical protein
MLGMHSFALRDSIGLNQHFETFALNNGHATLSDPRTAGAVAAVIDSGIKRVRTPIFKLDSADDWWTDRHHAILKQLTDAGVKLTVLFGWQELQTSGVPARAATAEQVMAIVESTYPGKIAAFEGPNEPDNFGVNPGAPSDWKKWTLEAQVLIRQARDKRPALRSIPIVGPSPIGAQAARAHLGPIDFMVDAVNSHMYTGNTVATQAFFTQHKGQQAPSTPVTPKPVWSTEAGYSIAGNPWPAITEYAQARLVIRHFLSAFKAGIPRTDYYDFIDDGTDMTEREQSFGLLRYNLSPRPAFVALKKLVSILDSAPANALPALSWSLAGAPSDTQSLVLDNTDGSYTVIIWREAALGTPAAVARLKFPGRTQKVSYDIMNAGSDCNRPIPAEGFDIVLSDDPVAVRVLP